MNNKNLRKKQGGGNEYDLYRSGDYLSNQRSWAYTDEERLTKSKDLVEKLVYFWSNETRRFQQEKKDNEARIADANWNHWRRYQEVLNSNDIKLNPSIIQKFLPFIQIEYIRLSISNFKDKYEFLKQNLEDIDLQVLDLKNKIQENTQMGGLKKNKKQSGGDCGCSNNRRLEKRK